MDVDAIKVGGSGGYNLDSANPFGAAPAKPDEGANGPLEEILISKNWKIRNSAYKKLTQEFKMAEDEKSSVFSKYTGFFKKMLIDTNPAAQAEATEAIKIFVDRAQIAKKCVDDVLPHLVKKAFASNKATTKANTEEIFSLYFELGCGEQATTQLLAGMKSPNFKVTLTALNITIKAMKEFGPKHVQYSKLTKTMPSMFNHKKGEVRELVHQLACEVFGFIGPMFHEQIKNFKGMRSATLDAIAKAFEEISPGGSVPTRGTRSEQKKGDRSAAGAVGGAGTGKTAAPEDPYSFMEAVDISKELSKNWLTEVMAPKWKDKKAKLEELLKLAGAPKIKMVPMIHDISKNLKKLLKDSNVIVRSFSIKCLEGLAKGIRKDFKSGANSVLENLLPWFKEKKASVLVPLNQCLDSFFKHCLSWSDLNGPVQSAFKDKVPQVRKYTLDFCIRCIRDPECNNTDLKKNAFKPLIASCMELSSDRDKGVRQSALECMATFLLIFGDRAMYPTMAKIENADKKKHKMVMDLAKKMKDEANGVGNAPDANSQPNVPTPAVSAAEPGSKTASSTRSKKATVKNSPKRSLRTKQKSGSTKSGSSSKSSKVVTSATSVPQAKLIDVEEAKEKLSTSIFPGDIIENIQSKKWKERVAGMDAILAVLNGDGAEEAKSMLGPIFSLFNKSPGWKDVNFQVCSKVFEASKLLIASASPGTTKSLCAVPLQDLLNKMSDRKVEPMCREYLTTCSEANGLKFLFPICKEKLKKVRNPKAIAAYIGWVLTSIQEFGAGATDVQVVIAYAKEWLGHMHKDVRANATNILVEIYKQTGKVLVDKMIEGLKSSQVAEIRKQFEKIPESELGKIDATRAVKGQKVSKEVKMDDIVPRVDISGQVHDGILSKLGDKKWQLRKEAMEEIESIVKGANCRIKGKDGGAFSALKLRLSDKNKNLIIQALKLIGLVVEAMGSGSGKYIGVVMEAILNCFADRKQQIREEAIRTLITCIKAAGLAKLVPYIPKGLEQTNARKDILSALNPVLEKEKLKKSEMKELVMPILKCCLDRIGEVRSLSEVTLKCCVEVMGFKYVNGKLTNFKKAEKLSLEPILGKYRTGDLLSDANNTGATAASSTSKETTGTPTKKSSSSSRRTRSPAAGKAKSKKGGGGAATAGRKGAAAAGGGGSMELLDLIMKCSQREKEKRAKKDARRMKGQNELDRNEIEDLKESLAKFTKPDFHKQLMHKNFVEFSKAINVIERALNEAEPKVYDRVVGILDLLLKWVSFRLCDGKLNTKVVKTLLKFLQTLTSALDTNEYEMLEGEAKNLLPYLLEKVSGHSMAPMREACHEIVQKLCNIYPASRILQELTDAMESKSKRVQSECLVEIGTMIQRFGINVSSTPKKTIMMMGKCVGTSDKQLREAALVAIANVYRAVNCDKDKVWKYFGGRGSNCKLAKKNVTMITERLKRIKPLPKPKIPQESKDTQDYAVPVTGKGGKLSGSAVNVEDAATSQHAAETQYRSEEKAGVNSIDMKTFGLPTNAFTLGDFTLGGGAGGPGAGSHGGLTTASSTTLGIGGTSSSSSSHMMMPYAASNQEHYYRDGSNSSRSNPDVVGLDAEGVDQRVEALRKIWIKVQEQGAMVYANDVDTLVEKVARQIASPYQMRLCKYALNTLMEFWQNLDFAAAVSYDTLKNLTRGLLATLLDESLRSIENGDKVMKALNVLTLKVLENAQRTNAFGCLLDLLSETVSDGDTGQFPDLVVKCLLKLTKVLPQTIGEIQLGDLVKSLHQFFTAHPPYSFKDQNDNRLRTVRRLVEELVNLRGREMQTFSLSVAGGKGSAAVLVRYVEEILGISAPSPLKAAPSTNTATSTTTSSPAGARFPSTSSLPSSTPERKQLRFDGGGGGSSRNAPPPYTLSSSSPSSSFYHPPPPDEYEYDGVYQDYYHQQRLQYENFAYQHTTYNYTHKNNFI